MSEDETNMLKTAASTEGQPTIFDKILDKSIPSTTVHDDDLCYAFADINPQGPFHCLVIPKERDGLTRLSNAREDQKAVLGHLMYTAGQIGKANCPEGFRTVVNEGVQGAQSVYHIHVHVIGGRQMTWPPG
ncbi:hypothetical protein TrVE_jg2627 [Triparma verrucosa]|uniref:HIT domain-containing protein n=3 Tax=Triparma TaxID=722752 RepID=A0A9W7BNH8_9STRA|nr:hypothetical protein TrVE_jg2627 [Triparma verrucosa]GMH90847.1 hypothetical protein TrST_g3892 [Triparma strigata]|eukprot:CAMPEP_0182499584 /NCGR_PEP_ID=MMETSP1321-20130603/7843_1 /TAXON_ID=91990 /ORGANISM="Bolidomonas sp., Strain RCC1657" /LENGTH=130 /DNA_ID=CAMNT_0024703809 /DNA_START=107 /DNA_END=499 /DNA_ORIENTATION=+